MPEKPEHQPLPACRRSPCLPVGAPPRAQRPNFRGARRYAARGAAARAASGMCPARPPPDRHYRATATDLPPMDPARYVRGARGAGATNCHSRAIGCADAALRLPVPRLWRHLRAQPADGRILRTRVVPPGPCRHGQAPIHGRGHRPRRSHAITPVRRRWRRLLRWRLRLLTGGTPPTTPPACPAVDRCLLPSRNATGVNGKLGVRKMAPATPATTVVTFAASPGPPRPTRHLASAVPGAGSRCRIPRRCGV